MTPFRKRTATAALALLLVSGLAYLVFAKWSEPDGQPVQQVTVIEQRPSLGGITVPSPMTTIQRQLAKVGAENPLRCKSVIRPLGEDAAYSKAWECAVVLGAEHQLLPWTATEMTLWGLDDTVVGYEFTLATSENSTPCIDLEETYGRVDDDHHSWHYEDPTLEPTRWEYSLYGNALNGRPISLECMLNEGIITVSLVATYRVMTAEMMLWALNNEPVEP